MGARRDLVVLVGAALVVTAVMAVVAWQLADDDPAPGPDEAAESLLDAYRRSRDATFALDRTVTRTLADGRSITYEERLTQVPPDDRLLVGAGAASGRLDGRVVRCGTEPGGGSRCFEGDEAQPWDEEVAEEVADLRSLVIGPDRAYDVETGPDQGCFTLVLAREVLAPPYGQRAVFCYDAATDAPTRIEVYREEASDVIEAVDIRTGITPADLRPDDLGDLVTG